MTDKALSTIVPITTARFDLRGLFLSVDATRQPIDTDSSEAVRQRIGWEHGALQAKLSEEYEPLLNHDVLKAAQDRAKAAPKRCSEIECWLNYRLA